MATYIHRPDCPHANENGMVEKTIAQEYDYYKRMADGYEDKRMMKGNEPVTLNVITDGMDYIRHMCNNKYYDSKSRFRQVTKEHGCIEVGNETEFMLRPRKPKTLSKRERGMEIKKAIEQVKSGNGWSRERLHREVYSKPEFKLE